MNATYAETGNGASTQAAYGAGFGGASDELALAAETAQAELAAHADSANDLRRQADKAELRLALRDLTSGLRGMIRVAPLASVFLGVALGVTLGRRRARRAARRR